MLLPWRWASVAARTGSAQPVSPAAPPQRTDDRVHSIALGLRLPRSRAVYHDHPRRPSRYRRKHDRVTKLVADLADWLAGGGWTEVEEIPAAVDLWARRPSGSRVIFEAKTLRDGTEMERIRSALAQLIEYRLLYGEPDDELCVVADGPIGDRRCRILDSVGIGVLVHNGAHFNPGSATAAGMFSRAM